jgi:hypothetical protein
MRNISEIITPILPKGGQEHSVTKILISQEIIAKISAIYVSILYFPVTIVRSLQLLLEPVNRKIFDARYLKAAEATP